MSPGGSSHPSPASRSRATMGLRFPTGSMKSGRTIRNMHTGESLIMLVDEEEAPAACNSTACIRHRAVRASAALPHRVHRDIYSRSGNPGHVPGPRTAARSASRRREQQGRSAPAAHLREQLRSTLHNDRRDAPSGGVVRAFVLAHAIASNRGAGPDGLPASPILPLRFVDLSQGFLAGVPYSVQRAVFAAARAIAIATGLERRVRQYLSS